MTLKKYIPVDFWKWIKTYSHWKILGQLELRIVAIVTSEAICERFIFCQRDVTSRHGKSFHCDTLEAQNQINFNFGLKK